MTNRERLSKMDIYDLLSLMHDTLAVRKTACILELIDKKFKCQSSGGTCEKCMQEWLNRDSNPPLAIGANTCVCCGAIIPEGWQVCRKCEKE